MSRLHTAACPALKDGLTTQPMFDIDLDTHMLTENGARVFDCGVEVFAVNEMGRRLLSMADGSVTIPEMVRRLGLGKTASDVALFFLHLGQAGYLKNRIEIGIYETKRSYEEERL